MSLKFVALPREFDKVKEVYYKGHTYHNRNYNTQNKKTETKIIPVFPKTQSVVRGVPGKS